MFHVVGNVALNDLHLFDLVKLHWVTVALYCEDGCALPLSRWGHKLVCGDNTGGWGSGDSLMLFGGVNLKSYCEGSTLFEFCIDDRQIATAVEECETKVKTIIAKQKENTSALSGAGELEKKHTISLKD